MKGQKVTIFTYSEAVLAYYDDFIFIAHGRKFALATTYPANCELVDRAAEEAPILKTADISGGGIFLLPAQGLTAKPTLF